MYFPGGARVARLWRGARDRDSELFSVEPSVDVWMARARLLVAMLFATLSTATATGQSASCPLCLTRTHVVRLELDGSGPEVVTTTIPYIVRTAGGEYLVGPVNRDQQLALYSPAGRFVRTIGRAGRGPGEFHSIVKVWRGAGDSVLVHDAGNQRLSILSPSLLFVRSMPFRDHRQLAQGNGFFIGVDPSRMTGGAPGLHVYESSRGLLRRHIPLASSTLRGDSAQHGTVIAAAPGDAVWAYRLRDSLLVQVDTVGNRRRQTRMAPSWHHYPIERVPRTPGTPQRGELPATSGMPTRPFSGVGAMDVDSAGLVWLIGAGPRTGWERRPSPYRLQQPETRRTRPPEPLHAELISRLNGWFETRVEVFNVSGTEIRSLGVAVLPTGLAYVLGKGYVAGVGAHDDGSVYVDVWRIATFAPRTSTPAARR